MHLQAVPARLLIIRRANIVLMHMQAEFQGRRVIRIHTENDHRSRQTSLREHIELLFLVSPHRAQRGQERMNQQTARVLFSRWEGIKVTSRNPKFIARDVHRNEALAG